ncbi:Predicted sugar epimerase, cupin superfamily [Saccharicrinis carchari]|uniref:Predicted sugar epimerase, cupin superfamily n=1 Tax=Saccharicrinis carchari TaxID=1168039 RepID=A0A521EG36_SACCC|nr:cupin domain-containing protein [Saccharicrinis carchari]SMO82874.1 Predicted sugar epimerase, cupin superfamily [Saccharicrinis carchari]
MLNVLIVYAVQEERVQLTMPRCKFHYCRTGVGKVAAAIAVEQAIATHQPDVVINIGTAGAIHYKIGSVHLCQKFVDRDMEKLNNFGVPFEEDFTDEVRKCGFFKNWVFESVCNTGDTFLTTADGTGDVFDMESFAVARVCRMNNVPFVGVKCVTDIIGQNSIQHWEEKLAEAQAILQQFVNDNPLLVPDDHITREARQIIHQLKMNKHPEGGWFKEVYKSDIVLKKEGLPGTFDSDRSALTSIYYLLAGERFSAFHKIKSPEVWYFHRGMPLIIHMIDPKGCYSHVELSERINGHLQYTVEPHTWFAAEVKEGLGYSLVSCAVAPGFDFADFELGQTKKLLALFPMHKELISRFSI